MDQSTLVLAAGAVVLVVLAAVLMVFAVRRRRVRRALRARYGPEYERTVRVAGSERRAVADLHDRETRREDLTLRDLTEDERVDVRARMAGLQYRFVEDPADVMVDTGLVVLDVLRRRGYPMAEDHDLALRLLAVDRPLEALALRAVVEGDYGDDVARMRALFVDARMGLADLAGTGWSADDLPRDAGGHAEGSPRRADDSVALGDA
jgi:hypothetical protein